MDIRHIKTAHLVGIGGINMSAVAKLLLAQGVKVTGSDVAENEQVKLLRARGVSVSFGHAAENVPKDSEILIHTSAAPASNPEHVEAQRRGLPEYTNFSFLAAWFKDDKTILVTGTHGKSTTTAMLGLALDSSGFDPTVIVGSKVPGFADGNLRLSSRLAEHGTNFVIEGDEYARHFLEFHPYAAIINNIELDHTDVYPTLDDYVGAFSQMLSNVQDAGIVVANIGDEQTQKLLERDGAQLRERQVRIITFVDSLGLIRTNKGIIEEPWVVAHERKDGATWMTLSKGSVAYRFVLRVHGSHNAMNAAGAALLALQLGAQYHEVAQALERFNGIWRRFELLGEFNGANVFSDYGHHPTAVSSTLAAAREIFPQARLVLCFQPHHRNRTKNLFNDFIPSFDGADVVVLCEIYDVAGRDASEDAEVSSKILVQAVKLRDEARGVKRLVEYSPDPASAVARLKTLLEPGDAAIIMGAGDIDDEIRGLMTK